MTIADKLKSTRLTPIARAKMIEGLIAGVWELPGAESVTGYWVDHEMSDRHVGEYCFRHGLALRDRLRRRAGDDDAAHLSECWSGDDAVRRCRIVTCRVPLWTGGLTDHGIDNALALTEADPYRASVWPAELVQSATAMEPGDPRWNAWIRQARRVIDDHRTDGKAAP